MLGKGSSPENGGHGTGFPGHWAQSQATRVQEAFGQCSQTSGWNLGWSSVEPGVGLNDPSGSLSICDILRFYASMTKIRKPNVLAEKKELLQNVCSLTSPPVLVASTSIK